MHTRTILIILASLLIQASSTAASIENAQIAAISQADLITAFQDFRVHQHNIHHHFFLAAEAAYQPLDLQPKINDSDPAYGAQIPHTKHIARSKNALRGPPPLDQGITNESPGVYQGIALESCVASNSGVRQRVLANIEASRAARQSSGFGSHVARERLVTGRGYGPADPPVRIAGQWSINDLKQGLLGHPPRGLGSPDLHHAHQMPGAGIHEIVPGLHRTNSALHPNRFNQGVTASMREADRKLHWWYRAREQGAGHLLPNWIYD